MPELRHYPFLPGVHQEVDPAVAPNGTLRRATNARLPRDGGVVKRRGSSEFATSTVYNGSQPIPSGTQGFGAYNNRLALAVGSRVYDTTEVGGTWRECGRVGRYLPKRTHFLTFDDTASTVDTVSAAMDQGGDLTAVTWRRGASSVFAVLDRTGARVYETSVTNSSNPRVITVDGGWIWGYVLTSTEVGLRSVTVTNSTFTLSNQTTSTLNSINDTFDIYPGQGMSSFFMASRVASTDLRVHRRAITSPFTVSDSHTVTVTNSALAPQLYQPPAGGSVYVAWRNNADEGWLAVVDSVLNTTVAQAQISAGDNISQLTLGFRNTTDAWLAVRNDTQDRVQVYAVGVAGITLSYVVGMPGLKLLSRPHRGNDEGFHIWLQNHVYDTTSSFQGHILLTRWTKASDDLITLSPELIPDDRPGTVSSTSVPGPICAPANVAQYTEDSEGLPTFFPAVTTIRTRAAQGGTAPVPSDPTTVRALVLYEYEARAALEAQFDGGDPVRIDEAAGAGLAFGGGLQELLSEHLAGAVTDEPIGSENGFIVSPQLSATATNGAGLTNSALYQGLALFEFIDPDGRRHRSCPSNLVSVTLNNAASLQITWSWDLYPYTERERSSQFTTTATHLYVTEANSSIFRRITPDTSAPVATTTNSFVQTNSQTATEIVYTLGGVKPNFPAPAHRWGITALQRVWLFGLFNPRLVECSKFFVPNEPAQFTRDPAFRSICPIDVTCGTEMDGVIYCLGPDGIATLAPGVGPNNQGNPALPVAQLLSRTGCISPGSVLRVPGGFMFEGKRGMYFLARGGSEPEYVGAQIAEQFRGVAVNENGGIVRDAALIRHHRREGLAEASACFAINAQPDFTLEIGVFDPESRRWVGFDTGRPAHRLGVVDTPAGESLVTTPEDVTTEAATVDGEGDNEVASDFVSTDPNTSVTAYTPIETSITTGVLRPFGLMGSGDLSEVALLVTVVDPEAVIACEVALDGAYQFEQPKPQPVQSYAAPSSGTMVDGATMRAPGDVAVLRFPVRAGRSANSVECRFSDSSVGPAGGVGTPQPSRVIYHGVTLLVTPSSGLPPQGGSRRVA